jgi:hypothetical protein
MLRSFLHFFSQFDFSGERLLYLFSTADKSCRSGALVLKLPFLDCTAAHFNT